MQRKLWWDDIEAYGSTVVWYIMLVSEGLLLSLVPTLLLVRLIRPRPSMRVRLRQPGIVAGLAFVFGVIWVRGWLHHLFVGRFDDRTAISFSAGCTVAIAWGNLAGSRKWQAEPSWIDRLGRVLGAVAIGNGLLVVARYGI